MANLDFYVRFGWLLKKPGDRTELMKNRYRGFYDQLMINMTSVCVLAIAN